MSDPASPRPIDRYLRGMIGPGASDLFLEPGKPPTLRINGELVTSDLPAPTVDDVQACVDSILTPIARERFDASPDLDLAYTLEDAARFRINVFLHQGRLGLVARLIPTGAVEFDALNLPRAVLHMAEQRRGLILVVGPTGCGKSTTLAALIHHINATRRDHIVTIEDPIEFIHEPIQSLIHQRQVGYDTASFAEALRHVVRQSPDTILIGEMRDRETMETAIHAALTGHLVLSTLHTFSITQSIDRMINYFAADVRRQVRHDLGQTLVGICAMRLVPRIDGRGRVPAIELLLGTPTVRRIVGEGALAELTDAMKRGRNAGMITLNQSLVELCRDGWIEYDDALIVSPNPDEFRLSAQGMTTGVESIDLRARRPLRDEDPSANSTSY